MTPKEEIMVPSTWTALALDLKNRMAMAQEMYSSGASQVDMELALAGVRLSVQMLTDRILEARR